MRIDTILQAASLLTGLFNSMSSSSNESTAFSTALSKANGSTDTGGTATKTGTSASATDQLLEKLNDHIRKGPVATLRDKILASMGLNETELKTLPPDKQNAVEVEVAERIKEAMVQQQTAATAALAGAQASAAGIWTAAANSTIGGVRTS